MNVRYGLCCSFGLMRIFGAGTDVAGEVVEVRKGITKFKVVAFLTDAVSYSFYLLMFLPLLSRKYDILN